MQTRLIPQLKETPLGQEADAILRSCVHCGFCNATCPTYQLQGDELDGPRGRIYLIKQMLEGEATGDATRLHLDRCLSCRACETTCPSGVQYSRLLDLGREHLEQQHPRPMRERLFRKMLRVILSDSRRLARLLPLARGLRWLLPAKIAQSAASILDSTDNKIEWPAPRHPRKMIILDGCVQAATHPHINAAAANVLDQLGISLLRPQASECCGALSQHLSAPGEAKQHMRRNIDRWWPQIEAGVEAIVSTASACSSTLKDYAYHMKDDPHYAAKAMQLASLSRDITEVIAAEDISPLHSSKSINKPIVFHAPCSLQHGLKLGGKVETILRACGYILHPVADAHLCCGAAGTYSILQPTLSNQLLVNKLDSLEAESPHTIATANIGCLVHLQSGTNRPVKHWIELLVT